MNMFKASHETFEKAKQIKAIIFDIDGVLTSGGIWYDRHTNELKRFNVKDGFIVKPLQKFGFIVGAIAGKDSDTNTYRCNELRLDFHYHGSAGKSVYYHQAKKELGLEDENICYIGDDLDDLPIITQCGLSACPFDARAYFQEHVDLIANSKGGDGAFRDIADYILDAQGHLEKLINGFLT